MAGAGGDGFFVVRRGQIFRVPAEIVTATTGKEIGPRWYVVVQSDKMNLNPKKTLFIVARITGRENISRDYSWQTNIDKAAYPFLDKDSTILGANLYTFERSDLKQEYYKGHLDAKDLDKLGQALKQALDLT